MSTPGEIQPLSSNWKGRPDLGRMGENTFETRRSSWHGRTTSASKESPQHGAIAREIITKTNSSGLIDSNYISQDRFAIAEVDSAARSFAPDAEKLADLIEAEWKKTLVWGAMKRELPEVRPFLQHENLLDALLIFLTKNRYLMSSDKEMIRFFKLFESECANRESDKIAQIAQTLIDQQNRAICAFLYMCRKSAAFGRIVKEMLPPDEVTNFIYCFASRGEATGAFVTLLRLRKEFLPTYFYTKYYKNSDDLELLRIGKLIGEYDTFERFVKARDMRGIPHLLTYFLAFPIKDNMGLLDKVIEYKLPLSREMLRGCFSTLNYPGIHKLLEKSDEKRIILIAKDIFKILRAYRDPILGRLFEKQVPYLAKHIDYHALKNAAEEGNDWFFEWAIGNGRIITPEEAVKLLSKAVTAGNLRLIKLLTEVSSSEGEENRYPKNLLLNYMDKPGDRCEMLMHFALFSPMEEIYSLVGIYPDFADALDRVLNLLPLLVRFPTMKLVKEVGCCDRSLADYIKGSLNYAEENRSIIGELLPMLKKTAKGGATRTALLEKIVEDRYSRLFSKMDVSSKLKPVELENINLYRSFRKNESNKNVLHETPLYALTQDTIKIANKDGPIVYSLFIDGKPQRYSWCLKHLGKQCYNFETNEWHPPTSRSVKIADDIDKSLRIIKVLCYTYTYATKEGVSVVLPMTKLTPRYMEHTPHNTIQELQDHLEKLHRELVLYNLDISDPKSLKRFHKMVAKNYWLIATLCETYRGTPHNAMIWLNLMYEHHKLPPPIPKIDHFFLDNTMIVTPLKEVVKNWETYFEPPLDAALEKSHGDSARKMLYRLLRKNGNLLRLCSPKVRDNEKMVKRAVRSCSDAIQFASKRLQNSNFQSL